MKYNGNLIDIDTLTIKEFCKGEFFKDFLNKCYEDKLISEEALEKIVLERMNLLQTQLKYYTKDKSSSIMQETALNILKSLDYTIGFYLKSFYTVKAIIDELKSKSLSEIFFKGNKLIKKKVSECSILLKKIKKNKLKINNYSYDDTIDYGLDKFFKTYDDFFLAHEGGASIDYQLYIDDMEYISVEYLYNYLRTLDLENEFCKNYNDKTINELLRGYDKKAELLLINVFELVFINSLGLIICGKDPRTLNINKYDKEMLKNKLNFNSLKEELIKASNTCCELFNIENINLKEYINRSVEKIYLYIKNALELGTLDKVFISFNYEKDEIIRYVDGNNLDDESLRNLICEISEVTEVKEKIKLIKENIKSLIDLTDMLEAECLYGWEYNQYFSTLSDMELALLYRYVEDTNIDLYYGKEWCIKFNDYLSTLTEEHKILLEMMKEKIIIE